MPEWLGQIEDAALRIKLTLEIHAILTSNAAQRINFTLAFIHVDGDGLRVVADALLARIKGEKSISVGIGDAAEGAAGSYTNSKNRISFPAGFRTQSWRDKQVVVHECVHAMQDVLGGASWLNFRGAPALTLGVDNEAAAYVAGELYFIYAAAGERRTTHPIYVAASAIARKIADRPGAFVAIDDVFALRTAIKSRPLYANLAGDPRSGADGL